MQIKLNRINKETFNMGLTEILILGFLTILGFLAFINSRKVTREINKIIKEKKS